MSASDLACLSLNSISWAEHLVLSQLTTLCWNSQFPGILQAGQNSLFRTATPGPRTGSQSGRAFPDSAQPPVTLGESERASERRPPAPSRRRRQGQARAGPRPKAGGSERGGGSLHQHARRPRSYKAVLFVFPMRILLILQEWGGGLGD